MYRLGQGFVVVGALLLLGLFMFLAQPNGSVHAASPDASVSNPSPPPSSRAIGGPAITPTLPDSANGARFTASDAADYVKSHHLWRSLSGTLPTIQKVEFLRASEVSARLGERKC